MPDTYDTIRSILNSAFRIPQDEIRPDLTLEQLDLDSLALTELVLIVHEHFGVKVDSAYASRSTTVAQVVDHLDALRTGDTGAVAPS
ncbi:phosphopantetheine-binding protein [Streptomyces sp. TRM 70351]|uniref:acyl carrier protein n=1 Tax=Streptomyces sp. TRM 70351 TaxID=3116552 RepID=UPI002E7BB62E|nr:phosphopantetheine-binding protein [Streptomyces sp. TRM 70351]MEE1926611.1 phosphopantetheine-binding protein [Streptomyces sp. TRM 70351]